MIGSITPEDRALIERTRKVNKTLSVFVFAIQERSNIPAESQIGIADMLVALADTIRERASQHAGDNTLPITTPVLPQFDGLNDSPCRRDRASRCHRKIRIQSAGGCRK